MPRGTSCTDALRFVFCDSFFKRQVLNIIHLHLSSESLIFEVHLTVKWGNSSTSWKSYLSCPYLPSLWPLQPQITQQLPDSKPKEMALNVCRNNDAPKIWIFVPVTVNCPGGGGGVSSLGGACRRASSHEAEVASAQELRRTVKGWRPAMVKRDVSTNVDWLWRASLFNADILCPVDTTEGKHLRSPSQDYRTSRGHV